MEWGEPRPIDLNAFRRRHRRRPSVAWLLGHFVLLVVALTLLWGVFVLAWALGGGS